MQVVEKARRINVRLSGQGAKKVAALVKERYPGAEFIDDEGEEYEDWEGSELQKEIKASTTPGKLVRAYRIRAGLTLVELAEAIGTKYPNLSAIENDRRAVGLSMARKLGEVLGVDYQKFIA
jgi:DNA-binding XRE family transcriptional regulator